MYLSFFYDVTINKLGDLEEHSCNLKMNRKYDDVLYNTIAIENENELNCSVPFHPKTTSNATGRIIDICKSSETGSKAVAKFSSLKTSTPSSKDKPCASMAIFMGLPMIDNQPTNPSQESSIKLYMTLNVKVKSMIMYYDFSTFVAEIGGYVGMFMGMSLMDFTMMCNTALFNFFTRKLIRY